MTITLAWKPARDASICRVLIDERRSSEFILIRASLIGLEVVNRTGEPWAQAGH